MLPLVICVGIGTALEGEALGAVAIGIPGLDKGTGATLGVLGPGMSNLTPWRVGPVSLEAFKRMLVPWRLTSGWFLRH
jgi:hypothetical protein